MRAFMSHPYVLAILISVLLILWLLSGQKTTNAAQPTPSPVQVNKSPPLVTVRVRMQVAEPLAREILYTARTAPSRKVILRSELDARIVEIGAERGAKIKQGDLILRLAVNDLEARLREAEALVRQRESDYRAAQNLSRTGLQSQTELSQSLALLESAKSLLKQVQIALENTVIRAPFAGILTQRGVEIGGYVSRGDAVAEVMDSDPFLVVGDIPERQRPFLQVGMAAQVRLITGEVLEGKVSLIAAIADEATRTFAIEVTIPNVGGNIAAGVTAEVRIGLDRMATHKVSPALLVLNDEGLLGVKAIDGENRVVFYRAEFARSTAEGVWLAGLPERVNFITVGQGFVRAGDVVQPVFELENNSVKQSVKG